MESEKLLYAIGNVDDDLIEEARKPKKRRRWKRYPAIAAALLVVAVLIQLIAPAWTGRRLQYPMVDRNKSVELDWQATGSGTGTTGMRIKCGISATVRPVEILPDTYYTPESGPSGRFRLVRMKTVKVLAGSNMTDEFYYILPEGYVTDLTVYDALVVIDMTQYSFENCVLYNETDRAFEAMDLLLFGSYEPYIGTDMIAITDDHLDEQLWTATESWSNDTKSSRQRLDNGEAFRCFGRGWRLNRIEAAAQEHCIGWPVSLTADFESKDAQDALAYIKPFENGVFVPRLYALGKSAYYTRYINGFPTNEVIYIDNWGADFHTQFTDGDLQKLPDLSGAVDQVTAAFEAGQITPPNLKGWEAMRLTNYSITGSYEKTGDTVYGIIQVTWRYQPTDDPNAYRLDDQYFVIEYGEETCRPIDYETYKGLLNSSHQFYEYDENGRVFYKRGYYS